MRKSQFRKFDDRTGRLERAIDLISDGQNPKVQTLRSEADRFNQQSIVRRVPPDRVQLRGGAYAPEVMKGSFVWMVGWQGTSNFDRGQSPAIVQGYNFARYTFAKSAILGGFGEAPGFGYFGFGGISETGPADGENI